MGVVLGKNSKVSDGKTYEKENMSAQNSPLSPLSTQSDTRDNESENLLLDEIKERGDKRSVTTILTPPLERSEVTNCDKVVQDDLQNKSDENNNNNNVDSNQVADNTSVKLKAVVDDLSLRNSCLTLVSKLNEQKSDGQEDTKLSEYEIEVITKVEADVEAAMKECTLDKPISEWASSSIAKQVKDIIFLTIKYNGQSLSRDLRKKVTDAILKLGFVQYSALFIQFTKTEIPEIFHKDESIYTSEIDELTKQKKKYDKKKTMSEDLTNENSDPEKTNDKNVAGNNAEPNANENNIQSDTNDNDTADSDEMSDSKYQEIVSRLQKLRQLKFAQNIIGSIMAVNINCSNMSSEYRHGIAQCGFVEVLLEFLEEYNELNDETEKADFSYNKIKLNGRLRIFNYVLGTLVNLTRFCEFHYIFKAANTVDRALPFLKCPLQLFAMKVLLALASLIEESNNHAIMSDAEPIKLLLMYIRGASKDEYNRYFGFELKELVDGLALIAQNDSNNKIIGENGGVKTISFAFLASTYIEEETEKNESLAACCHAIWRLSFNEENRKKLREDFALTEHLKKLKEMENSDLQEKASGSYWELVGKNMRHQMNNLDDCDESEETSTEQQQHIMISYQWNYQDTLLKVRDRLQESGFNVWMDVDQMGGSTLEAMAKAVEDASIVLMAVSSEYKQSANCRSEAEYAFQLKRTTIPLMMQANYTADGWLGFIVGAKYWIDFIDPTQFDTSFEKLMKEISKSLEIKPNNETQEQRPRNESVTTQQVSTPTASVGNWTSREVNAWLKNNNLSLSERKYKHTIDGKLLISLKRIKQEAPQAFYDICRHDLRFDFVEIIKFSEELSKLT